MAADADCAEAALIEALRSCNYQGLYDRISSFLLPFGELSPLHSYNPKGTSWKRRTAITPAPMKRGSTKNNLKPNALPLRPLANRFLPFLNRALKLLPVLLRKNDKSPNTGVDDGSAAELLQVYALILDCLACISPCLTGKPYSIHMQRFKLVESLEAWGRYEEAEVEALKLLESLSLIMVEAAPIPKTRKDKIATAGCYLPDPAIVGVDDEEVTGLVVDVVDVLTGCAYKRKVKNEGTYTRILDLIDQVQLWLQFSESHQKRLYSLVSKLHECSLFLLEEYIHFEGGMVQRFCLKMLTECARSCSIDHFGDMAEKIISSVDLQWAAGFSLLRDILRLTLDSILCSCKVDLLKPADNYLEIVSYFASRVCVGTVDLCRRASELLYQHSDDILQVSFPVASILSLYATGLHFKLCYIDANQSVGLPNSYDAYTTLFDDNRVDLQKLFVLLDKTTGAFHFANHLNTMNFCTAIKDSRDELEGISKSGKPVTCIQTHGRVSLVSYIDVFEFLCKPMVEFVNSAWMNIPSAKEHAFHSVSLNYVQKMLHELCDLVLAASSSSNMSKKVEWRLIESQGTLLQVAVAVFKISLMTDGNYQNSLLLINCIISNLLLEPQELKFLILAINNVGAICCRSGWLEKASKAFQMCIEIIWAYLELISSNHSAKSKRDYGNNASEDGYKDALDATLSMIDRIINFLYKSGATNIKEIFVKSFCKFSDAVAVAEGKFDNMTGVMTLMKLWVKIICKEFKDADAVDKVPVLYLLLLDSHSTLSVEITSKILEQELIVYELMEYCNQNLCQYMQLKVMDVLLNEVYTLTDSNLQRSSILIKKGRIFRAHGTQDLNNCLECLREAISLLRCISGESSLDSASVAHQLALAYLLYAQCSYEANQDCNISIEEVKSLASSLISEVPLTGQYALAAAYLYYDLSERLFSNGRFFEALPYAREALRLRTKILHRKFMHTVAKDFLEAKHDKVTKPKNGDIYLEAVGSSITGCWLNVNETCNLVNSSFTIDMHVADLTMNLFGKGIQTKCNASLSYALNLYKLALAKVELASMGNGIDISQYPNAHTNKEDKNGVQETSKLCSSICCICLSLNGHMNFADGKLLPVQIKKASTKSLERSEKDIDHQTKPRRKRPTGWPVDSCPTSSKSNCVNHKLSSKKYSCEELPNELCGIFEANCGGKGDSGINKIECLRCLIFQVVENGFMNEIIYLKREGYRRNLVLMLLLKIARCLDIHYGKHAEHEVHKVFGRCIYVMFNWKSLECSGMPDSQLIHLVVDERLGDFFRIERAAVLYYMSWFCLKNMSAHPSLFKIHMTNVFPWLLKAFILSQESPMLFQKVSQLLSSIFLLSSLDSSISFPVKTEEPLSINHWAAYFHQASVGAQLHYQYCYGNKTSSSNGIKVFSNSSIQSDTAKISKFFRISSEKLEDLEEHVLEFFKILPSIPIICVSMLGGDYANLIAEMLLLPSFVPAWILLCRLAANNQPIVILLPVDLIQEEIQLEDDISGQRACDSDAGPVKHWSCPWGYSVINYVLPSFKQLLEKNFLSMPNGTFPLADTPSKNACWWRKRTMLNDFLNKLLRTMEISWLGPWGCLLLGERLVTQNCDTMIHKFICALKSQGKCKINYSLIKAIICGANSVADAESCIQQSLIYKGYFGHSECCGKERFRAFSVDPQEVLEIHDIIKKCKMEFADPVVRELVILVLDSDVQMLPWENLPILRGQEVYRMPSVSSIFITLDRSCSHHKRDKAFGTIIPAVDPLNTYYLLNPSGHFNNTQVQFEQWFRNLGWEGKAGKIPTTEELILALQTRDLFLYFDHGSGTQYIPEEQIQQMDHCAPTLLMGCSSGSLTYSGCYAPQGAPLSYLSAGSPAVIATLWDVTDEDIDRFAKSLLSSWLLKELGPLDNCTRDSPLVKRSPCISINKEVTSTSLKTRRKIHNKSPNLFDGDQCRKRNMIASFISQA